MDLTIEPWFQGFWPALKETLIKMNNSNELSINNLSESINQLNFNEENKPTIERQLSSTNKFKSNEDSITYSSSLAELTNLTLPPKSSHSLSIKLIESSSEEVPVIDESQYHISKLIRRECLTHDAAVKPVMFMELQLSVSRKFHIEKFLKTSFFLHIFRKNNFYLKQETRLKLFVRMMKMK